MIDFRTWYRGRFGSAPGRAADRPRPASAAPSTPAPVACIVTCHNYGRFLRECLTSLIEQTLPPAEIIVVDDDSDDETPNVAAEFAAAGVKYLRVSCRCRVRSRAAGLAATRSPLVLFVDADDWLDLRYLEQQVPLLAAVRNIGIVYGDYIRVFPNGRRERSQFPDVATADLLAKTNVIPNISLTRRAAVEIAQALTPRDDDAPDDWDRWRRIVRMGWRAVKGPGLHYYRRHGHTWTDQVRDRCSTYYELWGLGGEEVTIIVPLAGRSAHWPALSEWLLTQTWPREQCRLLLLDTSHDPEFSREVRRWLAGSDYPEISYARLSVGPPGLADLDRRGRPDVQRLVEVAMCRLWTEARCRVSTDWILTLEDDVLPPRDVIDRLMRAVDRTNVAAVFAPYLHRYWPQFCHWDVDHVPYRERGRGIVTCGGGGFGCTLIRREALVSQQFWPDTSPHYDPAFWRAVRSAGWELRLCWEAESRHLVELRPGARPQD